MSASNNSPSPIAGVDWKSLPLDPREGFVLSRVDGTASPREIALTTGLPESDVLGILIRLAQLGAIVFAGARSDSPAPIGAGAIAASSQSGLRAAVQVPTETHGQVGASSPDPKAPPTPRSPGIASGTSTEAEASSPKQGSSGGAIRARAPHGMGSADTIPAPPIDLPPLTLETPPDVEDPTLSIRPEFKKALEEVCDLDQPLRLRILRLSHALEHLSHYELLDVPHTAEKKEIKNAYFTLVNELHTDRFFGKDLGTFKPLLEKIFTAATKAEATLTKAKTRAEYDKYISSRNATRGVRESMRPASSITETIETVHVEIPKAPKAPLLDLGSDDAAQATFRAPDAEAARRLLAKKFGLRGRSEGEAAAPEAEAAPLVDAAEVKKYVAEQMRARFEARQQGTSAAQIANYVEMAKHAYAQKSYGPAMNALRTALSLEPEHAEALKLYREVQDTADREHADQFAEQAKYEEADGHFARACRSYERAARGKRSAALFAKAAECGLQGRIDKRKIVELARSAVTIDGTNPAYRIALAKAYDFAGMKTSAVGELQRALEIDSKNQEAKSLLKALK